MRRTGTALVVIALAVFGLAAGPAASDSQTTNAAPYSCSTSPNVGTQAATYTVTATDTVDPATPGQAETYRFVVPFDEAKPPVAVTYKGGTTSYRIPAGLTVTGVSTQTPPGGSPISSTAAVQGNSIVVTSTANMVIDGSSHPTPDLLVSGTIQPSAAGPGITWLVPYQIVAVADAQGIGTITATCTPNNPNTTIATTTVPSGPKPPVATNQNVALPQGTSKAITLSATDPDTPLAQLAFAIAAPPSHGALAGTPPSVTYTPDPSYVGPDSFTFTVTDPQGGHSTGTVSINVFSSAVVDNTPPTISITSPTNGAVLTPGQVVNAGYTCADATTGIKSCTGDVASGAPIDTRVGLHTFTVNAVDNANNPAQATVSYRIVDTALVPSAVTQIPMDCGSLQPLAPTSIPVAASAPAQVGTGRSTTFHVALGAQSVAALTTATNLRYVFGAPTNGAAQSAAIEPGTGTPDAAAGATATISSGKVTLTLPGPIVGGNTSSTSFTPPVFDVAITAGTTVGSVVQTQFERFQEHTAVGVVTQDLDCPGGNAGQSKPNPILTSTTVVDTTPPILLIGKPGNGDVLDIGAPVNAAYGCADEHALATCAGTVPNGTAIDTATAGIKTFNVRATDAAGNVAQQFVSYTVVPPTQTFTARFPDSQGSLLDATAAHFGITRDNLPRLGVAFLAFVNALNPSAAHPVTPPANTGAIVLPTTYPRAEAPTVLAVAAGWGLDGDQLHAFATTLLEFFYLLSPH